MWQKFFKCPFRVVILGICGLILLSSVAGIFIIIHLGQENFISHETKKGRVVVSNLKSNMVILGKIDNHDLEYKEKEYQSEFSNNNSHVNTSLLSRPETNEDLDLTKPKVALIVGQLGFGRTGTIAALEMNNKIGLGFSPYSNELHDWVHQAVNKGFEVFLNLPMQPANYPNTDPGPFALLNGLSTEDNIKRLKQVLAATSRALGVYSDKDEVFTNSVSNISPVLDVLKQSGLSYLYGGDNNVDELEDICENLNLKYANIDIVLDDQLDEQDIHTNLLRLEGMARVRGIAIGKFEAIPISIRLVNKWINELHEKNITLVPITESFALKKDMIRERHKAKHLNQDKTDTPEKKSEFFKQQENLYNKELSQGQLYSKEQYQKYFNNPENIVFKHEPNAESEAKKIFFNKRIIGTEPTVDNKQ